MFKFVVVTASLVIAAYALRCHVVSTGNLSVPDNSQPQECGIGALSCLKVVDYARGTYTKQCQSINCTMNGMTNAAENCQNTSSFGVSGATCCCYGDGCNSAQTTSTITTAGLTLFGFLSARFLV